MGELEDLRSENEKLRTMVGVVREFAQFWRRDQDDGPGLAFHILGLLKNIEEGDSPVVERKDG